MEASIVRNGFLSEQLNVEQGCRHGDPVSPYIFLLCAEVLAILLKSNKNIKGIVINDKEQIISQFADDTTLILDGSQKSLISALETLEYYAQISGLRIYNSKTKIAWIGSKKYSKAVYHDVRWKLDWGSTEFNLLVIDFSIELGEIVNINYNNIIPRIVALLKQWKRRIFNPHRKGYSFKNTNLIIIPKLNHLFIALPNPSIDTLKLTCHHINRRHFCFNIKSISVHPLLWMNVMLDFICMVFAGMWTTFR